MSAGFGSKNETPANQLALGDCALRSHTTTTSRDEATRSVSGRGAVSRLLGIARFGESTARLAMRSVISFALVARVVRPARRSSADFRVRANRVDGRVAAWAAILSARYGAVVVSG